MKKYEVTSSSQFYTIGTADTLEEALKIRVDHGPADDTFIRDEAGNDVDVWFYFIGEIMDHDTAGALVHMTARDAETTMAGWTKDGVEIPAGLTAEALQWIWNWLLEGDEAQTASDPLLEKFQLALDCAALDRDEAGKKWRACEDYDPVKYVRYQQAQSYLEGLTNGIFVAGYDILTSAGKMTVIKKEA